MLNQNIKGLPGRCYLNRRVRNLITRCIKCQFVRKQNPFHKRKTKEQVSLFMKFDEICYHIKHQSFCVEDILEMSDELLNFILMI